MTHEPITADRRVDALYAGVRGRYDASDPRANGYVTKGYFRGEQQILFSMLNDAATTVVDVACGSGLMLRPLVGRRDLVIGIEFNAEACAAARLNGLDVVRGDAFSLPLGEDTVDEIVTCQFFQQQTAAAVRRFIEESGRVLRPGGRLVMVWRNGAALVHRAALAVLGRLDRMRGIPAFPYENHSHAALREHAAATGFTVEKQAVSFPPLRWMTEAVDTLPARVLGASNVCVLRKPAESA